VKEDKFCQALESQNKEQVKKQIDGYLASLSTSEDKHINFENIKAWLENKGCIKQVQVSDKIIATNPPVIEFKILMNEPENFWLGLEISFDTSFRFYDLRGINEP